MSNRLSSSRGVCYLVSDMVSVSCWRCNRIWRAPIMMLPPETTLAKIQALMRCHDCGNERAHVEPLSPDGFKVAVQGVRHVSDLTARHGSCARPAGRRRAPRLDREVAMPREATAHLREA